MAILENIKVTIDVDGQSLQEYDDANDVEQGQHATTKFVEAVSNAKFALSATLLDNFNYTSDAIELAFYLEGQSVAGTIIRNGNEHSRGRSISGQAVFEDNEWKLRLFQFVDANVSK